MSYPLPVPDAFADVLTIATGDELDAIAAAALTDPALDEETGHVIAACCGYELGLREQESGWRTAARKSKRWWRDNGNEASKVGVGVLVGAALGVWLD